MSSEWLSKEIADLLASPHISFPKGIHMGPGPVDLFSTKFNNLFALSVEAVVDGQKVSRDDLKQKLLNLQKHWNPEGVKFQDGPPTPPDLSTVAILSSGETVSFLAEANYEGGKRVIEKFSVNGASSLFQ